jgi:hypothetical protein
LDAGERLGRYLKMHKYRMTWRLLGVLVGLARRWACTTPEQRSEMARRMWHQAGARARLRRHGSPSPILKGQGYILLRARKRKAKAHRETKGRAELGIERERVFYGDLRDI